LAAKSFLEIFPSQGSSIFHYSVLEQTGEGILGYDDFGPYSMRDVRAEVWRLPSVLTAVREKQTTVSLSDSLHQYPSRYVQGLNHLLIVPICSSSTVIGFAGLCRHAGGPSSISQNLVHYASNPLSGS
jgi:hypothetical protein